jgi:hypothetical protein
MANHTHELRIELPDDMTTNAVIPSISVQLEGLSSSVFVIPGWKREAWLAANVPTATFQGLTGRMRLDTLTRVHQALHFSVVERPDVPRATETCFHTVPDASVTVADALRALSAYSPRVVESIPTRLGARIAVPDGTDPERIRDDLIRVLGVQAWILQTKPNAHSALDRIMMVKPFIVNSGTPAAQTVRILPGQNLPVIPDQEPNTDDPDAPFIV